MISRSYIRRFDSAWRSKSFTSYLVLLEPYGIEPQQAVVKDSTRRVGMDAISFECYGIKVFLCS